MTDRRPPNLLLQILAPTAVLAASIGAWALVVKLFHVAPYVLPSPGETWQSMRENWPELRQGIGVTTEEFLIGFVLGSILGFVLAALMAQWRVVRTAFYPILIATQAIPVIAIAPALIIWFGFGLLPKVIIIMVIVFFPVVVNVLDGLVSIDPAVINLARSMGAGEYKVFRHIKLPATYTPLFSALKLSATFSVTGAVIGEWTASSSGGLGVFLLNSSSRLDTPATFAAIVILAAMGILAFVCIALLEVLVTPWRTRATPRQWLPWKAGSSRKREGRPSEHNPGAAMKSNSGEAR
ncbi:MAG: ABC transporter permease [Solirubrobacterales bacterium]